MKQLALSAIRFYQRTLSPDHSPRRHLFPGGFCRYQPTCSEYTYQAINRFGVIKGSLMGTWRIMRCNPWSKGGWDPIEKTTSPEGEI